ncbi:MAG: hypothetical protein ACOC0W_01635 [Desulfosalsimonas sp.]
MKNKENILPQKKEIPWYRSAAAVLVPALVFAGLVFVGAVGLDVAAGHEQYRQYAWVPGLFMFCALLLFFTAAARIVRRRRARDRNG